MMTDGLSCESLTYDSPCFVREHDMRRSSLIVGAGARFLIFPRATRTCEAGEPISTRPGLAGTERRGGPRAELLRLVPGLVCVSARGRITPPSIADRDPDRVHRTRVGTNQAVVPISPLEKPGRKRPGLKGARWRAPRLPGSSLRRAGEAKLGFFHQGIVHHGPLQFGLRPFFQIRPETGTERSRRPEPPAT